MPSVASDQRCGAADGHRVGGPGRRPIMTRRLETTLERQAEGGEGGGRWRVRHSVVSSGPRLREHEIILARSRRVLWPIAVPRLSTGCREPKSKGATLLTPYCQAGPPLLNPGPHPGLRRDIMIRPRGMAAKPNLEMDRPGCCGFAQRSLLTRGRVFLVVLRKRKKHGDLLFGEVPIYFIP